MTRNLLPERNVHPADSDMRFYINTPVLDGSFVCIYKQPEAGLLDDPNAEVGPPVGTLADTIPGGLIDQEVIEFDNTRYSRDMSDDDVIMTGSKAPMFIGGTWNTRCVAATASAQLANKTLYYDAAGFFTDAAGSPPIGTFGSDRNANGYVTVHLKVRG